MRHSALLATVVVLIPALYGCGYSHEGVYRRNIQTVHVEVFGSREFRRDVEFALTENVQKRIAAETPYRIAPRNRADTILSGEVTEVRVAAWAPDPLSRLPREKQMTLNVRVRWKDQRNGEVYLDRPVELQSVDYLPPGGESEAFALQKVTDRMALKIVQEMRDSSW